MTQRDWLAVLLAVLITALLVAVIIGVYCWAAP
jgi:hypothetical protein